MDSEPNGRFNNKLNNGPVPKLIDYALTRTVLGQALRFFRLKALQNREFQGCFPKSEVLGKPPITHDMTQCFHKYTGAEEGLNLRS
jgi:hypothetical protein